MILPVRVGSEVRALPRRDTRGCRRAAQPAEWERLRSEAGEPDVAERELVAGVVLTTIAEWRPRPRHLLEVIEDARDLADAPLAWGARVAPRLAKPAVGGLAEELVERNPLTADEQRPCAGVA